MPSRARTAHARRVIPCYRLVEADARGGVRVVQAFQEENAFLPITFTRINKKHVTILGAPLTSLFSSGRLSPRQQ